MQINFQKKKQNQPPEVLCRKGILKNFANKRKTSVLKPLFNKAAGPWIATLLKRDPKASVCKSLRTPSLQSPSAQLLLKQPCPQRDTLGMRLFLKNFVFEQFDCG